VLQRYTQKSKIQFILLSF